MIDKLTSFFSRIFFTIASVLLVISVLQRLFRLWDADAMVFGYNPGRLFEFAGIFLLFVITLLLRQIRESLKK